MTRSYLDLSGKIDTLTIELYEAIGQITSELGIPYLVVGASARDLVLHYAYGTPIKRATTDFDFGMLLESWDKFEILKNKLIENDFIPTKSAHRFFNINEKQVDIVPFGGLEDSESNIQWPPEGDVEMNVLGFQEAFENAIPVILQKKPHVEIPVASQQGLVILKLVAWGDRDKNMRERDAKDFAYLLDTYERVSAVKERLYDNTELLEKYGWEIEKVSAHLLGVDSAAIAKSKTRVRIRMVLDSNLKMDGTNHLIEEMCVRIDDEYDKKLELALAFSEGFGR